MAIPKAGRHLLAAAVGVVLAAGTFGCGASHKAPLAAVRPQAAAASQSSKMAAAVGSFCPVANPAALTQAEAAGAIVAPAGQTLVPVAVAPDGSSFFAMGGTDVQSLKNLIWSRDRGHTRQTVFTLPASDPGFGVVAFDGRWLVFMADHSQDVTGAWDLYAWDSRSTAAPRIIATDPGTNPNSPPEWPAVRDGDATWIQGRPDGTQQVHLYNLAAGQDRVVHTGHLGASLFAGDLLVWTEALQPDTPATLAAATITTGAPAQLPAPLAHVQTAPATTATDGTTWAWTSPNYRTLYAWRAGMAAPVTVHSTDQGNAMDTVGVSGDVVTWTDSVATFAADLTTGSFTQVTKQYGSALANGSTVAVYYPLGNPKSPDLSYAEYVLKTSDLTPLPKC